jgi:hypothetical protein
MLWINRRDSGVEGYAEGATGRWLWNPRLKSLSNSFRQLKLTLRMDYQPGKSRRWTSARRVGDIDPMEGWICCA